ncbi:4610_t:CDS:2 [Funneliformis geosporum]|nr:4610_t:CDS:2 [Funneliformis geosporum]
MDRLIPEILEKIFKYIYDPNEDRFYTEDRTCLHSCLLVNRYWCKVSVPILWKWVLNDYGNIYERQAKVYTLLKCCDENSRLNLIDNGIDLPFSIMEVPIFQYASFIEILDYGKLVNSISEWLETLPQLPAESLTLVLRATLKLFVKESKITSFQAWPLRFPTDLIHLILVEKGIENLFLNVRNLLINTHVRCDRWLSAPVKVCRKIEKLTISIPGQAIPYLGSKSFTEPSPYYMKESSQMSSLIQHQKSLQKLKLNEGLGFSVIINTSLPSVKDSLTKLSFKSVDFGGCDPWYGICTLHMLEVFKCKNCKGLTVKMIEPLVNCTNDEFKRVKRMALDWNTDEAINAKEEVEAKKLVEELKSSLEKISDDIVDSPFNDDDSNSSSSNRDDSTFDGGCGTFGVIQEIKEFIDDSTDVTDVSDVITTVEQGKNEEGNFEVNATDKKDEIGESSIKENINKVARLNVIGEHNKVNNINVAKDTNTALCADFTGIYNERGNTTITGNNKSFLCSKMTGIHNEIGNYTETKDNTSKLCSNISGVHNREQNTTKTGNNKSTLCSDITLIRNEFKNTTITGDNDSTLCSNISGMHNEIQNSTKSGDSKSKLCSNITLMHNEVGTIKKTKNSKSTLCSEVTELHNEIGNIKESGDSEATLCSRVTGMHNKILNFTSSGDQKSKGCSDVTLVKNEFLNFEKKGKQSSKVTFSGAGTGASALNVRVSDPSFGFDFGVSGQASFLNVDIGTRFQLGLGFGLDNRNKCGDEKGGSGDGTEGGGDEGGSGGGSGGDYNGYDNDIPYERNQGDETDGGDHFGENANGNDNNGPYERNQGGERGSGGHFGGDFNGYDNNNSPDERNQGGGGYFGGDFNGYDNSSPYDRNQGGERGNGDHFGRDSNVYDNNNSYERIQGGSGGTFGGYNNEYDNTDSFEQGRGGFSDNEDHDTRNESGYNEQNEGTLSDGYDHYLIASNGSRSIYSNGGSTGNQDANSNNVGNEQSNVHSLPNNSPYSYDINQNPTQKVHGSQNFTGTGSHANNVTNSTVSTNKTSGGVTKGGNNTTSTKIASSVDNNNNENTESPLSSIFGNENGVKNSQQKQTPFQRELENTFRQSPRLLTAFRTSLSSNSTSDSSNSSSNQANKTSDSNSKPSIKEIDIRERIKLRVRQTEEAAKRKKQSQEEGWNSTINSTSGDSKSSIADNPTSQKKLDDEDEEDSEAPKPCKNHSPSVRCFRCLVGAKGKKVKRVSGNVYGFSN